MPRNADCIPGQVLSTNRYCWKSYDPNGLLRLPVPLPGSTAGVYPNSIKESISAVESKTGQLTGKHTLGKALDEMKKSGPYVHPSLVEGWKKIYGWASDEDGLRHGGDSAPTPDQDLARYVLVTCSAFVNLLTAAEAKQSK